MRRLWAFFLCLAAAAVLVAQAPRATLSGFAVLPADTFAAGPPSGAWLNGDAPGVPRFPSQPVQGVSGLAPQAAATDRDWWALSDNGYGAKVNSADFLLRIQRLTVDWGTEAQPGRVSAAAFIQLTDPDRKLPFPIAHEWSAERWLTGADLDPESLVRMPDGTFWIGDEFGPFLLHLDAKGQLLERPYEVPNLRSPDHPHLAPADAGQVSAAQAGRSRGFEGLAHYGGDLYAALEAGTGADAGAARVYEFNLETRAFTGQSWRVALSGPGHALTDFVSLAHVAAECGARFLAIERDGGHGPAAKYKRVHEVHLAGSALSSRLVLDLLAIDNPGRIGGHPEQFTFPFITTEVVWALDRRTLVLANDNNYPAGGGRPGAERDATEFIRVRLETPLCGF